MITRRRWSDTVLAEYREDGNPFGGALVAVTDSTWDRWENVGDDGSARTLSRRPNPDGVDRSPS